MTREEAMEILDKMPLCNECDSSNFPYTCVECGDAFLMAMEALKQPEIVLCKDCFYADDFDCPAPLPTGYLCQKGHGSHTGDWFCADGEKSAQESV